MEALLGIFGTVLFGMGVIYGLYDFIRFTVNQQMPSPAGLVMTAVLLILLGFQMILNAILLDIQSVTTLPLCEKYQTDVTNSIEIEKPGF